MPTTWHLGSAVPWFSSIQPFLHSLPKFKHIMKFSSVPMGIPALASLFGHVSISALPVDDSLNVLKVPRFKLVKCPQYYNDDEDPLATISKFRFWPVKGISKTNVNMTIQPKEDLNETAQISFGVYTFLPNENGDPWIWPLKDDLTQMPARLYMGTYTLCDSLVGKSVCPIKAGDKASIHFVSEVGANIPPVPMVAEFTIFYGKEFIPPPFSCHSIGGEVPRKGRHGEMPFLPEPPAGN